MEWKLFTGVPPEPLSAIIDRGWMDLPGQPGFTQRARMIADLIRLCAATGGHATVTDLGCGDGSLLAMLPPHLTCWGYEIGAGDVAHAQACGRDVRRADIVADAPVLDCGDIIVVSEVLEHLADPAAFLRSLPDALVIASSPSAETGDWHNPIHAWAWDPAGYKALLTRSGYHVFYQAECDGGPNSFGGVTGPQRFQAIVAAR